VVAALIGTVGLAMAYHAHNRCEAPRFAEFEFIDGGKAIVKTSSINLVVHINGKTRIEMRDGNFVVVKEKVSTVGKKLCM